MNAKFVPFCRRVAAAWVLTALALFLGQEVKAAVVGAPLSIQCPTNLTLWTCTAEVLFQYPAPVVSGGCSNYQLFCDPPPGSPFPVGTTTVTCRVIDSCQNVASCTFTVTVKPDTESPVIQCPPDITVRGCLNAAGICGAIVNYPPPVASDNSGSVAVVCTPPSGSFFSCGTHTVTCVAQDRCGNKAACQFTVVVLEGGQPPVLHCPTDITLFTCSNTAVFNLPTPVVFPAGTTLICDPPLGTPLPLGDTLVTCVASNPCGTAECKFIVTVRPVPPVQILCPTNPVVVVLPCGSNCVPVNFPMPTVVNGTLVKCDPAPGTCLPVGSYTVVCYASNECGFASCEFPLRVVQGQGDPPRIQCPASMTITVPCNSNCVPVFYPPPVVFNGALERCVPPPGTCLTVGTHVVLCRATNACASASCEFVIEVIAGPSEPPQITCPSNIVVWTCGTNGVVVNYPAPIVTAGSDPSPVVSCDPPSGSVFPPGITTVICRVKDRCGNESKCSFDVVVRPDREPPVLHCPSNIVICVPADVPGREVDYSVGVSDNADPAPTLVCDPPSGSFFPIGVTTVICRAVDQCGNESKCSFTITVLPDTTPVLQIKKEGQSIVVCWKKVCRCYKLQATRSLGRPILWVDVPDDPIDLGLRSCVRLPLAGGMRFFRLIACDQPTATVYGVVNTGLTREQAGRLIAAFNLPADQAHLDGGALLFLDPLRFQSIPTDPIQDQGVIDELTRSTQDDKGGLAFEGINFDKLRELRAIPGDLAVDMFQRVLRQVNMLPDNGDPEASHSMFEAVDVTGQSMLEPHAIDTHVNFHFNLGGLPLIGPGAKLSLVLSPDGHPTEFYHANRDLKPIQDIPILTLDEARRRCARLNPGLNADTAPRLAYYAPSLLVPAVQKIIPCYVCGGDASVGGQQVSLLRSIIPATDDPSLVPKVALQAGAQGNLVKATALVDGGMPPYTFQWVSSSTDLGSFPSDAMSIEYAAQPRSGETAETVRVIVTDANGVVVQAADTVEVTGGPIIGGFFAAVGGVTDYGTERAVSNMGAAQQSGFNSRFDSDGVTRRFNWTGTSAWERDFKEGGTGLDYQYVDNADIVFYIGHGNGGGFTFESNHDDGNLDYTDVVGAWGDLDLEWLALLSCQVLQDVYGGKHWWERWGPSFDGMHILLGFETNAHDWPEFGGTFADWVLGRHIGPFVLPGMPVRTSWFLAKAQQQPAADIAVAIGVLGPAGCSNYNDYFWGKGPVGPDIRGSSIHGYWRVTYQ